MENRRATATHSRHTLAQVRLSERNVVELVNKLQERGLLGDDLLHTINGREYLTVDRLRQEVISAVSSSGGRIPVVSPRTSLTLFLLSQGP